MNIVQSPFDVNTAGVLEPDKFQNSELHTTNELPDGLES